MLVERSDGKVYSGKLTLYVIFVCFVAGSGGLLFGEPRISMICLCILMTTIMIVMVTALLRL